VGRVDGSLGAEIAAAEDKGDGFREDSIRMGENRAVCGYGETRGKHFKNNEIESTGSSFLYFTVALVTTELLIYTTDMRKFHVLSAISKRQGNFAMMDGTGREVLFPKDDDGVVGALVEGSHMIHSQLVLHTSRFWLDALLCSGVFADAPEPEGHIFSDVLRGSARAQKISQISER
jgi:hypothetical protein